MKGNKNPEMELVWDEEKQMYVLAYIANTGQRSIFDKDAAWNQEARQEEEQKLETDPEKKWMNVDLLPGEVADDGALPGPVADERALPGEVQSPDDDVVEGDFREVGDDAVGDNGDGDDGYSYEEPDDPEE